MARHYFLHKDSEESCDLETVRDQIRMNGLTELEVFKAKRDVGSDYFFCRDAWEIGEKGDCGKMCSSYEPRNGKNGICKHNGPVYELGDKISLKL